MWIHLKISLPVAETPEHSPRFYRLYKVAYCPLLFRLSMKSEGLSKPWSHLRT